MEIPSGMLSRLKLTVISAFVLTAHEGSLSKAGLRLGLSQSKISRQIIDLETTVGAKLFSRTGRGVRPTQLGEVLLPIAKSILASADMFFERAQSTIEQPAGTVEISLPRWAADGPVSQIVNELDRTFPKIRLVIHEDYSRDALRKLAEGVVDLAIYAVKDPVSSIGGTFLFSADLVLIGHASSPLLAHGVISLSKLHGVPLVLPPVPNAVAFILEDQAKKLGVDLNVNMQINSRAMIRDAIQNCGRFGLSHIHGLKEYIGYDDIKIARIIEPSITLKTYCGTANKHMVSDATRAVEQCVTTILKRHHEQVCSSLATTY